MMENSPIPAEAPISAQLAVFAREASIETLSPEVLQAAKTFLFDTIAVAVAGASSPYAKGVRRAAGSWGVGRGASILPDGGQAPAGLAAFVNAFQAHANEFDCVHEGAVLHPFTVVAPVLLAEAEQSGLTGRRFLEALIVGSDIAIRLGLAARSQIRFFRPAICGLYGAAAALGAARQAPPEQIAHAFGYALSFASGTMQAHVEGTPALAVSVGHAAQSAFWAMDLAAAGLPGPLHSIEGPFGHLALFEEACAPEAVLEGLGRRFHTSDIAHKPFPTGRAAHGGIAMSLELRAMGVEPNALEALTFHVPPLIGHLVGRPVKAPLEVNYARLCLPYCAASALARGPVGLQDFTPHALADARVLALGERIDVIVEPNPDPAAFTPQRAVALLTDGRRLEAQIEHLPGRREAPLSMEQQQDKAVQCFAAAGLTHEEAQARVRALYAAIDDLDSAPDAALLVRIACGKDIG